MDRIRLRRYNFSNRGSIKGLKVAEFVIVSDS